MIDKVNFSNQKNSETFIDNYLKFFRAKCFDDSFFWLSTVERILSISELHTNKTNAEALNIESKMKLPATDRANHRFFLCREALACFRSGSRVICVNIDAPD